MERNGGGKWQLAFWMVTIVCCLGMFGLSQIVRANEKDTDKTHINIRKEFATGDEKVIAKLEKVQDKITKEMRSMRKEYRKGQTALLVQQTKILTLLGQSNDTN